MSFLSGTGTLTDPYIVSTAEHLNDVRNYLSSYFKQVNDINISSYSNWIPIGTSSSPFTGSYDGNKYYISDCGAELSNLHTWTVWGLFGYATNSTLTNIVLNGRFYLSNNSTMTYVGGLCAVANNVNISNCESYINLITNVCSNSVCFGGLVGKATSSHIYTSCTNNTMGWEGFSFSNQQFSGGFIGDGQSTVMENCYANSNVTNQFSSAGFIIKGDGCTMTNCYSNGNIVCINEPSLQVNSGAFSGKQVTGCSFNNCYYNEDRAIYWDSKTHLPELGASGLSTSQFKISSNFNNWDFQTKWHMYTNADNPTLVAFMKQIWTADELNKVRYNLNGRYTQYADIDLSSYSNWVPIGSAISPFTGNYNGQIFKISNLNINSANNYVGLFGSIENIDKLYNDTLYPISNITLDNCVVRGNDYVGALVGRCGSSTSSSMMEFYSCSATNVDIIGNNYVGGLIGQSYSNFLFSSSTGSVSGISYVGGLTGSANCMFTAISYMLYQEPTYIFSCFSTCSVSYSGTISNSSRMGGLLGFTDVSNLAGNYSTGTITGYDYSGGLIGEITKNSSTYTHIKLIQIYQCYSTSQVSGHNYVGGLIGYIHNYGSLVNSYAMGNVSGNDRVGGLLGQISNCTTFNRHYSCGVVSGSSNVGGLVGYLSTVPFVNYTSDYSSFYNSQISGQTDTGKGTPKTTAEMKLRYTFREWDFDVWEITPSINNGYPHFAEYFSGYFKKVRKVFRFLENKTGTVARSVKYCEVVNGTRTWKRTRSRKINHSGAV